MGNHKHRDPKTAPPREERFAWKERTYVVPSPSRKRFEWKASALRSIQRLHKVAVTGNPVTVVVPAIYNFMPAEAFALGWLNEIDALGTIRNRIVASAKITGWDVFTFHTRHNLDSYYTSTITAVRETWMREGSLKVGCIADTVKQFGAHYQYNRIPARLVENLVFQSSLMEWLSSRADGAPLRFHAIGSSLMSAMVWAGSITFENAVKMAVRVGTRWDNSVSALAEKELQDRGVACTEENLGWQRFNFVRRILEGRHVLSLGGSGTDVPPLEAPSRPVWFSPTPNDEPVLLETVRDVRYALESMDLSSWSPRVPQPLPLECPSPVQGYLISPLHPMAANCRWSVYNYLLSTPKASLLFLDHIAALGRLPMVAMNTKEIQDRVRISSRVKAT